MLIYNKTIIWGLNEYSKYLLESTNIKVDFIFDKFSKEKEYLNCKVINDISILKNKTIKKCIISSTTYYMDIIEELNNINKNIEIAHISNYIDGYPRTIIIKNKEELINCKFIKGYIKGKVIINKCLILQLRHDTPVVINVNKNAELHFNNNILMDGVEIAAEENSKVSLGNRTYMSRFGMIRAKSLIEIGSNCVISWNVVIMDNDGYSLVGSNTKNSFVKIGSNIWIGNSVNILKNTDIGFGSMVGSMSKLSGKFMGKSLIVGNPAKIIKKDIVWE